MATHEEGVKLSTKINPFRLKALKFQRRHLRRAVGSPGTLTTAVAPNTSYHGVIFSLLLSPPSTLRFRGRRPSGRLGKLPNRVHHPRTLEEARTGLFRVGISSAPDLSPTNPPP